MYNLPMNTEIYNLKTLSDRLNYALKILGTKKAELARAIDVKPQVIQFLCSSQTQSSRFTFEIATVLGLNTRWLATGEGDMYVENDKKNNFYQEYKKIPLLTADMLKKTILKNLPINNQSITSWIPLKTNDEDIFTINMPDSSMEPYFPVGASLFIRKCFNKDLHDNKFVFSYVGKFDTFVVRELITKESEQLLVPKNLELFKEISVTDDIKILGIVTDCLWHLRS